MCSNGTPRLGAPDNLYELNVFDDQRAVTPLQVDPRLRSRVITIGGVAKGYSMTGWRIGWAAGPREIIADMARVQYLHPCGAFCQPQHPLGTECRASRVPSRERAYVVNNDDNAVPILHLVRYDN